MKTVYRSWFLWFAFAFAFCLIQRSFADSILSDGFVPLHQIVRVCEAPQLQQFDPFKATAAARHREPISATVWVRDAQHRPCYPQPAHG